MKKNKNLMWFGIVLLKDLNTNKDIYFRKNFNCIFDYNYAKCELLDSCFEKYKLDFIKKMKMIIDMELICPSIFIENKINYNLRDFLKINNKSNKNIIKDNIKNLKKEIRFEQQKLYKINGCKK